MDWSRVGKLGASVWMISVVGCSGPTGTGQTSFGSASDTGTGDEASAGEQGGTSETGGDGTSAGSGDAEGGDGSGSMTSGGDDGSEGTTGPTTGGDAESTGETGESVDICRHVDVVLAVDNSGSMQDAISELNGQGTFDLMVDTLINEVGAGLDDFHIAVMNACPKPALFHDHGDSGDCQFSSGHNYMVGSSELADDPDCQGQACTKLLEEYACVTRISDDGYQGQASECIDSGDFKDDDEQPAFTAAESLSQTENDGFLRDDAILFVIAMTDEDEEMLGLRDETSETPQSIAQRFIDAKQGNIENVVFLGIGGPQGGCENGPYGDAQNASQLRAVTSVFEDNDPVRGLYWNFCDPRGLVTALQQGLTLVSEACEDIVIPQ